MKNFVEKPNLEKAQSYINEGQYFWNSGMFLIRADIFLEELGGFRPDILKACQQSFNDVEADQDFVRPNKQAFEACPKDSIDYAIMEKSDKVEMIPLDAQWSDIGSWSELASHTPVDSNGNSNLGDILTHDASNNYLRSEKKLLTAVGIHDLIVVDSDDSILVAHKDSAQDVKKIVEQLEERQRPESKNHLQVYRPWGWYKTIDLGTQFKVKHISVKPGAKLSLQKHHHRAEHWIVVSGTALVTNGEKQFLMSENESTYIPIGHIHRLENPGKIPLSMIEVQSGNYLEEDDIVRLEDDYNRN